MAHFLRMFGAAALMALAPISAASAFDVLPTVTVLELPKDRNGGVVTVSNPRTEPLPISVTIFERKINEDGTEEQTPADNLFRIFPAQAVVQPNARQAIRVIWNGPAEQTSRSFTLYIGEVPVDLTGSQSGVQRVLRIGASIHIAPRGTAPKLRLVAATPDGDGMRVTLENNGNRFIYMDEFDLGFPKKLVAGTELVRYAQRTLLPPGARRTFVVPSVQGQPTIQLPR